MEFKLVKLESGVAVFNFDELKADLVTRLADYKGYLVTDENLALAKTDRASLNKLAKAIDDKRKEVKKEIMKIYDSVFEPQCKELTTLIKNASDEIDLQVKALEDRERQAKYQVIVNLWNGLKFDLVSLDRVIQEAWLNKGTTERKIQDDMQSIIANIKTNLQVIETMGNENEATLKAKYLATLDLQTTLNQFKAEQEAKARLNVKVEPKEEAIPDVFEIPSIELCQVDIKVIAPENKLMKLRAVLENNGYVFEQLTDIAKFHKIKK